MDALHRVSCDGVEIEYATHGVGEHVVFVHHGAGIDWFTPLFEEPALPGRFCVVHYHRPGYGGSGPLIGPLTFEREAVTFRALMRAIGVARAHIVGHSASGCMALQFALDVPDIVHSAAVLEPALMAVPSPPGVLRALELYRAGERTSAVQTFIEATCGPNAGSVLERAIPGAVSQALADADTFFSHELPALRTWPFGPSEAARIQQPVLSVLGEHSDPRFRQRQQLLLEWLPHVEPFILTGAGHLLHVEQPTQLATALSSFFSRHSSGVAT
jgi:pimeloyl-ACP methyl ester carboxylesterase